MAVTSAQATQYENQSSSLNSRANNISNLVDNYVASVNTNSVLGSSSLAERSDGQRLENEAQDTLNNILLFLNRNEVREGQSDLVYGTRITDAVAQAREAKAIAQAALDTIRASLVDFGSTKPSAIIAGSSAGLLVNLNKIYRPK
mgnify:CR=1 FL=1